MSKAIITESYLTGIANAIRAKLSVQDTYTPPQMAAAIASIPTGSDVTVEALSVAQNGTYTAPTGKAYSPVTVNVSGGSILNNILISPKHAENYKIINGRIVTGFNAEYGYIAPANNNGWLDIDWAGTWEIGVAFKVDNLNGNFALFGNESTTLDFSSVPSIELLGDGLAYGISNQANSWTTYAWAKQGINANMWYFVVMAYNQNNMIVSVRTTNDFTNYDEIVYTMPSAPYHSSSRKIGFGGLGLESGHTKAGAYIDLHNCYIKYSGNMVWGAYTGAFPS